MCCAALMFWIKTVCLFARLQELSDEKHDQAVHNEYNFDSPDAFDTECIVYTLRRLKEGKSVEIPVYNFTTHRVEKKKVVTISFLSCFYIFCRLCCFFWPSVLWRCWLGDRKGIRPVKNWVVGCWCGYLSGARCRLAYGPADATATHCLLLQ